MLFVCIFIFDRLIFGLLLFCSSLASELLIFLCTIDRCFVHSLDGQEPWGAIADFRLYARAFSVEGGNSWPSELTRPPPTFPAIPRPLRSNDAEVSPFVDIGAIDNVRKWLMERGISYSIVALLKSDRRSSQLLERAVATLANIALYPPSIPHLLRQTVSVDEEEGEAQRRREELIHLREEENMLLVEEIRLRERITAREINIVRDVEETASASSGRGQQDSSGSSEIEGCVQSSWCIVFGWVFF